MPAIHTVLDIAGLLPVVGEPLDAINAAILAQGDNLNAGLSAASMIPVVGSLGILAKGGNKVGKAVEAGKSLKYSSPALRTSSFASNKSVIEGVDNKILWGSWNDYKKITTNGQEYARVGERLYSRHALDRMQPSGNLYGSRITQAGGDYGRSVAPQYVEDVIKSSKRIVQANGNLSYTSGSLQVITNPQGAVVTIITH